MPLWSVDEHTEKRFSAVEPGDTSNCVYRCLSSNCSGTDVEYAEKVEGIWQGGRRSGSLDSTVCIAKILTRATSVWSLVFLGKVWPSSDTFFPDRFAKQT